MILLWHFAYKVTKSYQITWTNLNCLCLGLTGIWLYGSLMYFSCFSNFASTLNLSQYFIKPQATLDGAPEQHYDEKEMFLYIINCLGFLIYMYIVVPREWYIIVILFTFNLAEIKRFNRKQIFNSWKKTKIQPQLQCLLC